MNSYTSDGSNVMNHNKFRSIDLSSPFYQGMYYGIPSAGAAAPNNGPGHDLSTATVNPLLTPQFSFQYTDNQGLGEGANSHATLSRPAGHWQIDGFQNLLPSHAQAPTVNNTRQAATLHQAQTNRTGTIEPHFLLQSHGDYYSTGNNQGNAHNSVYFSTPTQATGPSPYNTFGAPPPGLYWPAGNNNNNVGNNNNNNTGMNTKLGNGNPQVMQQQNHSDLQAWITTGTVANANSLKDLNSSSIMATSHHPHQHPNQHQQQQLDIVTSQQFGAPNPACPSSTNILQQPTQNNLHNFMQNSSSINNNLANANQVTVAQMAANILQHQQQSSSSANALLLSNNASATLPSTVATDLQLLQQNNIDNMDNPNTNNSVNNATSNHHNGNNGVYNNVMQALQYQMLHDCKLQMEHPNTNCNNANSVGGGITNEYELRNNIEWVNTTVPSIVNGTPSQNYETIPQNNNPENSNTSGVALTMPNQKSYAKAAKVTQNSSISKTPSSINSVSGTRINSSKTAADFSSQYKSTPASSSSNFYQYSSLPSNSAGGMYHNNGSSMNHRNNTGGWYGGYNSHMSNNEVDFNNNSNYQHNKYNNNNNSFRKNNNYNSRSTLNNNNNNNYSNHNNNFKSSQSHSSSAYMNGMNSSITPSSGSTTGFSSKTDNSLGNHESGHTQNTNYHSSNNSNNNWYMRNNYNNNFSSNGIGSWKSPMNHSDKKMMWGGTIPNNKHKIYNNHASLNSNNMSSTSNDDSKDDKNNNSEEEAMRLNVEELKSKVNPAALEEQLCLEKTRYFVIKSYSEDDVHRSIKYGIWCSTKDGNKRLNDAYLESQKSNGHVLLLFSVNGSGHFCGIAEMRSAVDFSASAGVWCQSKWRGRFFVHWWVVKDIPNTQLRHITTMINLNMSLDNTAGNGTRSGVNNSTSSPSSKSIQASASTETKPITNVRDATELLPPVKSYRNNVNGSNTSSSSSSTSSNNSSPSYKEGPGYQALRVFLDSRSQMSIFDDFLYYERREQQIEG